MEPRPVGHMILDCPGPLCLCGHDFWQHADPDVDPIAAPCEAERCGCADFEDADPDSDGDFISDYDEEEEP